MRQHLESRAGVAALVAVLCVTSRVHAQDALPMQLLEPDYLLSVGEIVDRGTWRDVETIVGAEGETRVTYSTQTQFDLLHVPRTVGGRALAPGDRLQFFRLERRIDDPATREPLGSLLLPTGVGTVDSLAGETVRVRVTDAYHPIVVGDRVRVVTATEPVVPAEGAGFSGGRIVAFQEEKAIHSPFDRMFLRPESAGGLAPGQVVELYRPGERRRGVQLPDEIVGKAMIVRVDGALAAAVTFELERADLAAGDLFRALPATSAD